MLEKEPKIKKIEQPRNEAWERLENSPDKAVREMIRRGILSLEKITDEEIEKDKKEGKDVALLAQEKGNGTIKEKIINYTSEAPDGEYAEYTEKLAYEFGDGIVVHFENFLPSGWKLRQDLMGFRCSESSRTIGYNDLEEGWLLAILHEIGHAWVSEKTRAKDPAEFEKMGIILKKWNDFHQLPKEQWRTAESQGPLEGIFQMVAQSERDAWAFALKVVRTLKNCGRIITDRSGCDLEELEKEIAGALSTYQEGLKKKFFLKGSKMSEEEIRAAAQSSVKNKIDALLRLEVKREEGREKIAEESFRKLRGNKDG